MALSDIKRLQYKLVGVLLDVVNDRITAKGKKEVEEVIHDLKVMDAQTHSLSYDFAEVRQEEVEWHIKALRTQDTSWSNKCATAMENMWGNLKKVDKVIRERN